MSPILHAPLRGVPVDQKPWEGQSTVSKPWDYPITVAIPVIDGSDFLPLCVELIRLQTVPAFLMVIDTGSSPEELARIERLRAADLEVHSLRINGVRHPSDLPAIAMDLAFALCRSEYLFGTHADVFLRRRDFLEELLHRGRSENIPVQGYEITPRAHDDWRGMISHTASLYHMPTMDRCGVAWSLRRLCSLYGIHDYAPDPARPSWPDTEILSNYIFRHFQLKTHIIGREENYERTLDENIDHPRSIPSAKLYSPDYMATVRDRWEDAKQQARLRIEQWRHHALTNGHAPPS